MCRPAMGLQLRMLSKLCTCSLRSNIELPLNMHDRIACNSSCACMVVGLRSQLAVARKAPELCFVWMWLHAWLRCTLCVGRCRGRVGGVGITLSTQRTRRRRLVPAGTPARRRLQPGLPCGSCTKREKHVSKPCIAKRGCTRTSSGAPRCHCIAPWQRFGSRSDAEVVMTVIAGDARQDAALHARTRAR